MEGHEGEIGAVRTPITELCGAEVAPYVPLQPLPVIGAKGRRTEPQIPIEEIRHRLALFGWLLAVGAPLAVPNVDLPDFAKDTPPDELERPPEGAGGRALVAHAGGNLLAPRQLAQGPRFVHGASERLFAVNGLSRPQGGSRGHRMGVVRCGYNDGFNLPVHRVEHFTIIAEFPCLGPLLVDIGIPRVIDVT